MDHEIFKRLSENWQEFWPDKPVPHGFHLMKVQGKFTPNACIVALILDAEARCPVAVVRIPRNPKYTRHIEAEHDCTKALVSQGLSDEVLRHVPRGSVLASACGRQIHLQGTCSGHSMVREFTSHEHVRSLYPSILSWMRDFHEQCAQKMALEGDNLSRHILDEIERIKKEVPEMYASLSEIAKNHFQALPDKVKGNKVTLTRQHGDFNAHNTLVQMKDGVLGDFAIIDWEDSSAEQLPIHDLNHFFISNSKLLMQGESAESTFDEFILSPGWYQDLYIESVRVFSERGLIDEDTFWRLTPLYLLGMCARVNEYGRQQGNTAAIWLKRTELFINSFPKLQA